MDANVVVVYELQKRNYKALAMLENVISMQCMQSIATLCNLNSRVILNTKVMK
jgi:hypothetical protein